MEERKMGGGDERKGMEGPIRKKPKRIGVGKRPRFNGHSGSVLTPPGSRAHMRDSAERNNWEGVLSCAKMMEELGGQTEMTDSWFSNSGATSIPGAKGLPRGSM